MFFRYKGRECKATKSATSGSVNVGGRRKTFSPTDWVLSYSDGTMDVVGDEDWVKNSVPVSEGHELSVSDG